MSRAALRGRWRGVAARLLPGFASAAVLVTAAVLASTATAAEPKRPSAGLRAYGLDWIQYLRPRDLPPTRYAVCIVDTGVAITPDTPPDNPNGPIIKRLAIDGGSGEPQGTTPEHLHGTRMAATAVAPRNNWGMVGMFPQGRVISVRATVNGEATFHPQGYTLGVDACLRYQRDIPIAAINLSLGCATCQASSADLAAINEAIKRAAVEHIPVIVAAGNEPGRLSLPADRAGVLAVAAGGRGGQPCRYSPEDERVFAIAPACPVVAAEPLSGALEPRSDGGSSVAALEVSALLSALRTLRPTVAPAAAGAWLTRGRRGRMIDGRRAARVAGVSTFVRSQPHNR